MISIWTIQMNKYYIIINSEKSASSYPQEYIKYQTLEDIKHITQT